MCLPYNTVHVLLCVYLITVILNTVHDDCISPCSVMWSYLKHMAEFLENIATVLDGVSSEGLEDLKYEMTASNRRRTTFSSAARPKKSSRILSVRIYPGITGRIAAIINQY